MNRENKIIGCYKNDGSMSDYDNCDYIQIKLNNTYTNEDKFTLISKSKFDIIDRYVWYINKDGYAVGYKKFGQNTRYSCKMHRLIMNDPELYVIDHINNDRLDNRDENLRICTQRENSYNTSKRKNKYKGVVKNKNNTYNVVITKDNKKYTMNNINSEIDAAKMYDIMAEELFGEFAGKNFKSQ